MGEEERGNQGKQCERETGSTGPVFHGRAKKDEEQRKLETFSFRGSCRLALDFRDGKKKVGRGKREK